MKKIINSSTSTYGFKAFLAFFTCLSFLIIPSCQKDESNQDYLKSSSEKLKKPKIKQDISDIDGNVYKTVKIGNQLWMAENLRTTKYKDGVAIEKYENNETWSGLTTPAFCWYNNDESVNKDTYGAIYNWYAVNTGKLCPTGWHVPTDAEFTNLIEYLTSNGYGYEGSGDDVAKSLATTSGWYLPQVPPPGTPSNDQASNNSSGFNAVPGGLRHGTYEGIGTFGNATLDAFMWTTSEYSFTHARFLWIRSFVPTVQKAWWEKKVGLSVRCLQDYNTTDNNISIINTTWDFTIHWSESVSWHADVTFNTDGTTIYDEPEYPGVYLMNGTWTLNDKKLDYIMDASGSMGSNYHFTGKLSGNTMSGTFTLGNETRPWSATLK